MSYNAARPRYTLPLGGTDYELIGSFELIEAAEYALKDNIVSIHRRVIEMPSGDTVKLLVTILEVCGYKLTAKEIKSLIWEMGISSEEFTILRIHIHAFLRICISKPADREDTAKRMGELLGEQMTTASLGENTSNSA